MSTPDDEKLALDVIQSMLRALQEAVVNTAVNDDQLISLVSSYETVIMDISNQFFRTNMFSVPSLTPSSSFNQSEKILEEFTRMSAIGGLGQGTVLDIASRYYTLTDPHNTMVLTRLTDAMQGYDRHRWDKSVQLAYSPMLRPVIKKLVPENVVDQETMGGVEKIFAQLFQEMIYRESNFSPAYASWVARLIDEDVLSAAEGIFLKTARADSKNNLALRTLELVAANESVPFGWQREVLVQATVKLWLTDPNLTLDFDQYIELANKKDTMEHLPVSLVMTMMSVETEEAEVWQAHKRRYKLMKAVTV